MNAANGSSRSTQCYIHPANTSAPRKVHENKGKYPYVRPIIHQDYRSTRRWPPSPVAEDEVISLSKEYLPPSPATYKDEARSRGEIDQQPLIIAIHHPTSTDLALSQADTSIFDSTSSKSSSSSEVSSPRTPLDTDQINIDRRYVYVPETGIEIPVTYDEPRTPKYQRQSRTPRDKDGSRSRKELSRLETNLPVTEPLRDRPLHHERARSPYAYPPKPARGTTSPVRGEIEASRDVLSPKIESNEGGTKDATPEVLSVKSTESQPIRPSTYQRVSDIRYPSEYPRVGEHETPVQPTPYPVSSDESDLSADELYPSRMRKDVGIYSQQSPPKYSMPRLEDFSKRRADQAVPYDAVFPPAPVVSAQEKIARPTYIKMPSSAGAQNRYALPSSHGLQYGTMPPLNPGLQHGIMPLTAPGLRYEDMSPSNPHGGRRISPQGSATPSPRSSPPATPEKTPSHEVGHAANRRNTPPGGRYSQLPMRSRSPSPVVRGASYIQTPPGIDVREPQPARPDNITHAVAEAIPPKPSRHTTLTPFLSPQPPVLQVPAPGARRRALSNLETRPKVSFIEQRSETFVSPLPPPAATSKPPSHHRTVSFGSQPLALLPCPRPSPVAGFTDWYTLVDNSSFSICPSCRRAVFGAGYEKHFEPRQPESAGYKRRCGMSNPWMRMAILLTMSTKRPDPNLIYSMADITVDELPCPGKTATAGEWYRVVSAESGKQVSGFNVCPCCVRYVESMFPALRGVFQKSRSRYPDQKRSCDLRADSKRFTAYVDLLESIANQAQEFKRAPNLLRFTDLAEKMAAIPECSRDDMLLDQLWHTAVQIPELTVCEDCYREVVRPAARQGYSVAEQFSRKAHRAGPRDLGISCQMYSARMRGTFLEACRRDDLARLKSVALQRHQIETDLQRRIREVRRADIGDDETLERITGLSEEWKRWE